MRAGILNLWAGRSKNEAKSLTNLKYQSIAVGHADLKVFQSSDDLPMLLPWPIIRLIVTSIPFDSTSTPKMSSDSCSVISSLSSGRISCNNFWSSLLQSEGLVLATTIRGSYFIFFVVWYTTVWTYYFWWHFNTSTTLFFCITLDLKSLTSPFIKVPFLYLSNSSYPTI